MKMRCGLERNDVAIGARLKKPAGRESPKLDAIQQMAVVRVMRPKVPCTVPPRVPQQTIETVSGSGIVKRTDKSCYIC
jgi:hypothetical protein